VQKRAQKGGEQKTDQKLVEVYVQPDEKGGGFIGSPKERPEMGTYRGSGKGLELQPEQSRDRRRGRGELTNVIND